jgi:3-hydroxyacyl-[acyl-carrier-protein] dehydratase
MIEFAFRNGESPVDHSVANNARYRTVLRVPTEHPCLPGHFPGRPLVPGVLLLEHVANALRDWRSQRLARVLEVKFVAPLLPGEEAELELDDSSGRMRFAIQRREQLLARGVIEAAT